MQKSRVALQRRPRRRRVGAVASSVAEGQMVGARPSEADDFDSWVTLSSPRLLRLALLVGHETHAADAVQDALLAVLVRWRRLSEPGAADAYARRVIVNHRISWWRRIGRREHLRAEPRERPSAADDGKTDALLARELLRQLPDRQRAAVVLRYFDDLTFAEIADILRCPESTARSHVHRALTRLRAQLGEEQS